MLWLLLLLAQLPCGSCCTVRGATGWRALPRRRQEGLGGLWLSKKKQNKQKKSNRISASKVWSPLHPKWGCCRHFRYFSLMLCVCFVCWGYAESLQKDASLVNL